MNKNNKMILNEDSDEELFDERKEKINPSDVIPEDEQRALDTGVVIYDEDGNVIGDANGEFVDELPPVETGIPPIPDNEVIEPEIVHNAYADCLQDLLKKQWDVINSCDSIIAMLNTESNVTFDKESVMAVLRTITDETTKAIGMTTKSMTVVDPTQDELMKEGEKAAEDVINATEKEVVEAEPVVMDDITIEPVEENLEEDTVKKDGKWVNKGKEGTHGEFNTKKEADAQRKAMFANGYHEDYDTVANLNRSGSEPFANKGLSPFEEAMAWEALWQVESRLEYASEDELNDSDNVEFILNNMDEEQLIDLCIDVAESQSNNDWLWEKISDAVSEDVYDKAWNYKDDIVGEIETIQLGNETENNNEEPEGE